MRRLCHFLSLALVPLLVSCWVLAGDSGPAVEFKTKLGVTKKFLLKDITVYYDPQENFTDRKGRLCFLFRDKKGFFVQAPLYMTKNLTYAKDEWQLTLSDDSQFVGMIEGTPSIRTKTNEFYPLPTMVNLKAVDPEKPKKLDGKDQVWTVSVPIPINKTFETFSPNFSSLGYTSTKVNKNFFGDTNRFGLIFEGEPMLANTVDFEKMQVEKQDNKWKITLQAPKAQEVSGFLQGTAWTLHWESPAGYFMGISSETSLNGFTLIKGKKAHSKPGS